MGHQLGFPELHSRKQVVNVASVPQRSPFRYPGGKTWLVPRIRCWLDSQARRPILLTEPFAGGAIVGLTAVFEDLVDRVLLVELDDQVAAVWQVIVHGDAEWLADRILTFKVTQEIVAHELNREGGDLREIAFRTLLRNRTSHGGIMAPGAGLIKHGENGKGLTSRWYPHTIARRIRDIGRIRERIDFIHGDGMGVIRNHAEHMNEVFFIDPPYTAGGKRAGTRLYTYNELDHEDLFAVASTLRGDFLMTYDNAQDVHLMALRHGFQTAEISMQNTHHAEMDELLIGRNLGWLA